MRLECSNCTLLELKVANLRRIKFERWSSNCTLLELKVIYGLGNTHIQRVLIVPYWN